MRKQSDFVKPTHSTCTYTPYPDHWRIDPISYIMRAHSIRNCTKIPAYYFRSGQRYDFYFVIDEASFCHKVPIDYLNQRQIKVLSHIEVYSLCLSFFVSCFFLTTLVFAWAPQNWRQQIRGHSKSYNQVEDCSYCPDSLSEMTVWAMCSTCVSASWLSELTVVIMVLHA